MNKLYTLQGVVKQTGLKQSIAVVARSESEAMLRASPFAEQLVVERIEELSTDWK